MSSPLLTDTTLNEYLQYHLFMNMVPVSFIEVKDSIPSQHFPVNDRGPVTKLSVLDTCLVKPHIPDYFICEEFIRVRSKPGNVCET